LVGSKVLANNNQSQTAKMMVFTCRITERRPIYMYLDQ